MIDPQIREHAASEPRLDAWIHWSARNAFRMVGGIALVAIAAIAVSARIRVDGNLDALLPNGTRTVRALEKTRERFGSADLFTVSIVASDPAVVARLQDQVRGRMLRDWPFVQTIQTERDQKFFRHSALLFLPEPQLERIEGHLRNLRNDLRKGPLGMDLLSDGSPEDSSWLDSTALQRLGLPDEATNEFRGFLKGGGDTAADPKSGVPDSLRSRLLGRLADGRFVGLVQAVLSRPSSDIDFVKDVLARSRALLSDLSRPYGKGVEIGVEGPYKDLREVDSLTENGTIATVVSVLLTLLIMVLVFRRAGPILLVLGQAMISCALTLGFATLAYGRLNLYTVFVIAILFGMGTDYSFYVVGYAQRLVRRGADWESALARTFSDLASSLLLAWATTVAGLLVLLWSMFPGFHEFGAIASVGITASLMLTWIGLPAATFATLRLSKLPLLGWISPAPAPEWIFFRSRPWMRRLPGATALLALVGALCLVPFARRVGFEYDFAKLQESGTGWFREGSAFLRRRISGADPTLEQERTLPVEEALGTRRTSSQPVVVLVEDPAVLDRLHDTLSRRLGVEHDTLLAAFLTPRSFVPPRKEQLARLPHLRRMAALLRDPVFDQAVGADSAMVLQLRDMAGAEPFGQSDIPSWARDLLRERDGSTGRIGFIYDRITNADARDAEKFESRYGHFDGLGGEVTCFSSSFVYADLVRIVREDGLRMTWIMAIVLCALIVLVFRRWRPVLVCLLGMTVSLAWILGIMGLFDIRFGVFNLIVITTLQAALTDVVIYQVLAWERQRRSGVGRLYGEIGTLMSVAIGTTLSGFAGMLFTSHLGIRSIGLFAVVGLGVCLVSSLAVVPWLCSRFLPPSPPAPGSDLAT